MKKNTFRTVLRAIVLLMLFPFVNYAQSKKAIHAGNVMLIPGQGFVTERTIVVENGRIIAVEKGYVEAKKLGLKASDIIDLKDQFVMPGFIDLHTHITDERDPNKNRHEWTTLNDEDAAFRTVPYLESTLMAGFTTVRNLGAPANLINATKRSVNEGIIAGPRIYAATGAITPTGGHGDFHGYREEIMHEFGSYVGVCDGKDDCARAVRAMVKQGADVIKITATGGVLSNTGTGVGQQLTDEEMLSIVATAKSLGRKVAAHAHEADGINAALRAGVNSIEHGSYLDDESVRLFNKTGAYLVPTLLAGVSVTEELEINKNIPPYIQDKIKQVGPVVEESFKRALKGDVKIAFGTDSGVSKHGTNAREFELMVKYGMDPEEAIKSATVNASDLLGTTDTMGTLEIGKYADIVGVKSNPLKDISVLKQVSFVMKEGNQVK